MDAERGSWAHLFDSSFVSQNLKTNKNPVSTSEHDSTSLVDLIVLQVDEVTIDKVKIKFYHFLISVQFSDRLYEFNYS